MNVKFITACAGFFGLGAVTAWAITADHADRKNRELKQEVEDLYISNREKSKLNASLSLDIEEFTADMEAARILIDELEKSKFDVSVKLDVVENEDEAVELDEPLDLYSEEGAEVAKTNLQRIVQQYVSNEDDRDEFVERAVGSIEASKHEQPYVISQALYAYDEETFNDKVTLTYFERHRLLLEDDDVVSANEIDSLVGWRNLNQFGGESGDPDTVFVRNNRLGIDYEVVRETEEEPPLHVKFGMEKDVFDTRRAAGLIKFREEDV